MHERESRLAVASIEVSIRRRRYGDSDELTPGKNFSISITCLILASLRLRAYVRARVRNALYFRERADVAQLVEQCIRNA